MEIRRELAAIQNEVLASHIQEAISKRHNLTLSLSTIRGRFIAMGNPLSAGCTEPEEEVVVEGKKKGVKEKEPGRVYAVDPVLAPYIPSDAEFASYIDRQLDKRLGIHYMAGKYPISQGPQGTGKTFGHAYFAWKNKLPFFLFSCFEDFSLVSLFGDKTIQNGSIVFQESLFVRAIQSASVILFDEINALSNSNTFDFHALLQNRKLFIKDADNGKGKVYNVHNDCFIGFAQNPRSAKYIGGNVKSSAFLGRCTYLTYPDFTMKEITSIIKKRFPTLLDNEVGEYVKFFGACRDAIKSNSLPVDISIRQLINVIDLYMHGMKLEQALEDGLISVMDSISQPKARQSFETLAEATWKTLMDIKKAAIAAEKAAANPQAEPQTEPQPVPVAASNTVVNVTVAGSVITDINGNALNVGDTVETANGGTAKKGIIRHIGTLDGSGLPTSIWSEWGEIWDGKLVTRNNGGQLRWAEHDEVAKQ
jgi:hypothetical protein